jgi:hypothetical protein
MAWVADSALLKALKGRATSDMEPELVLNTAFSPMMKSPRMAPLLVLTLV